MYDQSLEQLIDAVIADGVITDQERIVIYKKAASLGIDQDEIQVYLEGKLAAKKSTPKSDKYGTIRKCPNCGAPISSFSGKCAECGYEFSTINANETVKAFKEELEKIDRENKTTFLGSVLSAYGRDDNTKKKIQLIKTFTIPNTKEDLIEFALLCGSNLSSSASTTADMEMRKAWRTQAKLVESKARLLFPNDLEVKAAVSQLSKERKSFFKANQKTVTIVLCLVIPIIFFSILFHFINQDNERMEEYTTTKIEEVDNLPTPSKENYLDCYRDFNRIHWTESKHGTGYESFMEAMSSYRDLLIAAYKDAGVSDEDIPESLKSFGLELKKEADVSNKDTATSDNGEETDNQDSVITTEPITNTGAETMTETESEQ